MNEVKAHEAPFTSSLTFSPLINDITVKVFREILIDAFLIALKIETRSHFPEICVQHKPNFEYLIKQLV